MRLNHVIDDDIALILKRYKLENDVLMSQAIEDLVRDGQKYQESV